MQSERSETSEILPSSQVVPSDSSASTQIIDPLSPYPSTLGQGKTSVTIPNEIPPDREKNTPTDNAQSNSDSEYEYDYEDEEECLFSGFLMQDPCMSESVTAPDTIPQDTQDTPADIPTHVKLAEKKISSPKTDRKKPGWREPTREAVSMSLRAEKETSGGRRRLASDLYKVMMGDTLEQGYSMEPFSEESMEKWVIKLFKFDEDSNLNRDLMSLGLDHVELEMTFPDQYPFEPPFVRVVRPRFKRQTGFVMNGALCMELLTSEGWNPVNDIESVIVSIRSLLVVGDGRLAAVPDKVDDEPATKRRKDEKKSSGSYTTAEAKAAYSHLTAYHKKKGWDSSGWWARKG